jgi:hypothetical protein
MNLIMRSGKQEDARACGAICYRAFKAIVDEHHFPPDFPDTEMAVGLMNYAFPSSDVYSVVAESNGQIAGSNFLWESRFIGKVILFIHPNFLSKYKFGSENEVKVERTRGKHLP